MGKHHKLKQQVLEKIRTVKISFKIDLNFKGGGEITGFGIQSARVSRYPLKSFIHMIDTIAILQRHLAKSMSIAVHG